MRLDDFVGFSYRIRTPALLLLCGGLSGAFATEVDAGQFCFAPTPYAVGADPSCVIMADLDGDGLRDLAVANHDELLDNRISILINTGSGAFAPSVYYDTGDRPYWIAAGDIDGDADLDLAVSNFFDTTVSVFLNNSDGTFAPQITYEVGLGPGFVVMARLDGDADLDLAVGNISDDTVSIRMNNGDGTFAEQATYPAGPGPYGIVAADLDNDGPLDLAVSNHHLNTLSVLHNNGDGTFAPLVAYTVDDGPVGNDAGDLNNDGFRDLVVANTQLAATGTTVSVLMNNGDGTFAPHVPYTVPVGPYTIKIADFNGDGFGDMVCSNESGTASVVLNNTDGTFTPPTNFTVGARPVGLDVGDLDGNGTPEIAVTCYDAAEIWVLFNQYVGITQQPADVSVAAGQAANFTVVPAGPGPFTYQWRRNFIDLVDGGNISGANTDTLSINPASAADTDVYDVIVTNDCGPVTSDPAQLTISPSCAADISPTGGDGVVNVNDLLLVVGNWGATGANPADVNGDRVVNVNDLLAVVGAWGPCQ